MRAHRPCWIRRLSFSLLLAWCLGSFRGEAHTTSDSYLRLRVESGRQLTGEWRLALHDLELAVGLDRNEDGSVTWGELKGRRAEVLGYARERLAISVEGADLPLQFRPDLEVDRLANGTFAVLRFEAESGVDLAEIRVDYRVFFDVDRLHRGLLLLEHGENSRQAVFHPAETRLRFELDRPDPWLDFVRFCREGVWHIWIGYDHILFLLSLLLPSVLRRTEAGWEAEPDGREVMASLLKVVTAFTLAHSVTLGLAALGWVNLPSRWVEVTIAGSIVAAALNNLRPVVTRRAWLLASGFGLVHGFGFASVLADLRLPAGATLRALVGFNLGVELGQLAIVAVFLPLAFATRRTRFYRTGVLVVGSWTVVLLAAWWMVERLGGR